jgi:hypothetical protein
VTVEEEEEEEEDSVQDRGEREWSKAAAAIAAALVPSQFSPHSPGNETKKMGLGFKGSQYREPTDPGIFFSKLIRVLRCALQCAAVI